MAAIASLSQGIARPIGRARIETARSRRSCAISPGPDPVQLRRLQRRAGERRQGTQTGGEARPRPRCRLDNVEIAAANVVSREPVVHVRNIHKHYAAYKLLTEGKLEAPAGSSSSRPPAVERSAAGWKKAPSDLLFP